MMVGDTTQFNKCTKPDCFRKVKPGIVYCCHPCALADEKKYEIHDDGPLGHTPSCNERAVERGTIAHEDVFWYKTFK
jgi:hypothetical protein